MVSASVLESLAGVFHPHAIGVQDFEHYKLVIDVRPRLAYEEDHIPGAVQLDPMAAAAQRTARLPRALMARVSRLQPDAVTLIYCGSGGIDSERLARLLRQHGREVDVLPGGWINYRRWVKAGLEVLPRLIMFQTIAAPSTEQARYAMKTLATRGLQVLDIEALAEPGRTSSRVTRPQTSQAWFESLLLRALRGIDPGRPVWVIRQGGNLGPLSLPAAMPEALEAAPEVTPNSACR